jgi:hypothetical protein
MSAGDQTIDRIENALVTAIGRRQRLRRRQLRAGAATALALLAALGVLALTGLGESGPESALAITTDASMLTVRVTDASASPDQMTAELRAAGANVEVRAEPAALDAVGHWIAFGTLGPATPAESVSVVRELAQQIREHPDFLTVPKATVAKMLLVVGRAPRAGEQPCTGAGAVVVTLDGARCPDPAKVGPRSGTR